MMHAWTFAALVALTFPSTVTGAQAATDAINYKGRDGAAEARAVLAAGRQPLIYSHVMNGRVAGYRSPGLLRCDGWDESLFVRLPEAEWREPMGYTDKRHAAAAVWFAGQFNRAMFQARSDEVRLRCPSAELDPRWPQSERDLEQRIFR
jgi:hypothetical protein